MNLKRITIYMMLAAVISASACRKKKKEGDDPIPEVKKNTVPAFYNEALGAEYGKNAPELVLVAGLKERVRDPWDIDFHPFRANELWVLNKGTDNTGGTTVTISNAGLANQSSDFRIDGNAWHFMALPSALSFSKENGNWGTSSEIQDANRSGGSFTGPSLWSSDMAVYAKPSGGNGSHLDMLHGSPYSMGIESDKDNAFWVFDAFYGSLVWYDFVSDHGPGNADHSDGRIRRYTEVTLSREPNVPSHLVMHKASGWLYIADTKNSRIIRVNTKTGSVKGNLAIINEPLAEHSEMQGVEWNIFKADGLKKPAGIEVIGDVLFVGDYETGEIIAYNIKTAEELARLNTGKDKLMGIKADSNGKLWFVANGSDEIYRVEPK